VYPVTACGPVATFVQPWVPPVEAAIALREPRVYRQTRKSCAEWFSDV